MKKSRTKKSKKKRIQRLHKRAVDPGISYGRRQGSAAADPARGETSIRVMGVFPLRHKRNFDFSLFFFCGENREGETEKKKNHFIDLFLLPMKIYVARSYLHFLQKTLIVPPTQIRLRRLRKLGVSSANEKSDESGNQKTAKPDETSNNNNSTADTTPSTAAVKDDNNKNVILSGETLLIIL